MRAALLDPLVLPARLLRGLMTGGGNQCVYHALHHLRGSARSRCLGLAAALAHSHTFGDDSDANSDDEVDIHEGSLSLRRRSG
jgi:hypothetical protein